MTSTTSPTELPAWLDTSAFGLTTEVLDDLRNHRAKVAAAIEATHEVMLAARRQLLAVEGLVPSGLDEHLTYQLFNSGAMGELNDLLYAFGTFVSPDGSNDIEGLSGAVTAELEREVQP